MEKEIYFAPERPDRRAAKSLTVIIYDIPDQKQRNRMVKYLERFGYRVQKSAFEAWLDERRFRRLCAGMDKLTQPEDRVKVYRLRGASETYIWGIGQNIETEDIVII